MPAHHLVAAADAAVGDDAAAGAAKVVVLVKREALRAVASPPRNRVAPKLKGHSVRKAKDVVVKAAKAGDKAAQDKADKSWQDNANQIAGFLSKANPNWPRATVADLMKMHLSTTTAEVVARLKKDWEGDVRAYDAVYDHILKMADALSDGIIKQFPEKFGAARTDR